MRPRQQHWIFLVLALLGVLGAVLAMGAGASGRAASGPFDRIAFTLSSPPEGALDRWTRAASMVFGTDDRVAVEDTTAWPYRTVTQLVMFDPFGEIAATCSGILLNVDVVLTAARCLWDDEWGEPYDSILVIPGEDRGNWPFGTAYVPAGEVSIPRGFVETDEIVYDFGLAHIALHDYGTEVGPFAAVASAPDAFFRHPRTALFTAGYPGDKPLGTMWWTTAAVEFVDDEVIYTSMDAYQGQSGSGIFAVNFASEELAVVGVYSSETASANLAVRFSLRHVEALRAYCADAGCSITTVELHAVPGTATATPSPTPSPTPTQAPPRNLPHHATLLQVGRD
jgi:V8-like Glu-specific endopeptidase